MNKIFFAILILGITSCQLKKTDGNEPAGCISTLQEAVAEVDKTEREDYYEDEKYLEIPENYNVCPDNQDELVPPGFCQVEKIVGDLNKDGLDDYILIIKDTKKENWKENQWGTAIVDKNRRGIIIALNKGSHYQKYVANYSCFASENEDGGVYFAPEMSAYINDKGDLIIHYSHGRYGYWLYTFHFQNDTFELIGYESHANHGPIPQAITSINFLTKKKKTSTNVSEDEEVEKWEDTWEDIEYDEPINLENITNFEDISF